MMPPDLHERGLRVVELDLLAVLRLLDALDQLLESRRLKRLHVHVNALILAIYVQVRPDSERLLGQAGEHLLRGQAAFVKIALYLFVKLFFQAKSLQFRVFIACSPRRFCRIEVRFTKIKIKPFLMSFEHEKLSKVITACRPVSPFRRCLGLGIFWFAAPTSSPRQA